MADSNYRPIIGRHFSGYRRCDHLSSSEITNYSESDVGFVSHQEQDRGVRKVTELIVNSVLVVANADDKRIVGEISTSYVVVRAVVIADYYIYYCVFGIKKELILNIFSA